MFANDLPGFDNSLAVSDLATDEFWKYQLNEMTPLRVEFFYHRARFVDKFDEAKSLVRNLQAALLRTENQSFIKATDLVLLGHRVPDPIFTIDDFVDGLNLMTEVRQNALLFALETGMDPDKVIGMRWNDQVNLPSTPCIRNILKTQAELRHLKLPYVFWEREGKTALPLVTLREDAEMAFCKSWPAIVVSFKEMVMVSPAAGAAHLRQLLDDLGNLEQ